MVAALAAAAWIALRDSGTSAATPPPPAAPAAAPLPQVSFQPLSGAVDVRPDVPVIATVRHGRIVSASLTDGSGTAIAGTVTDDGSVWRPGGSVLLPDHAYRLTLRVARTDGRVDEHISTFTTLHAQAQLGALVTPGDDDVVGVGMPIVVRFDAPVQRRDEIVHRLTVVSSPPVRGGWRWVSDRELHFRPEHPWPAGADVHLAAALAGVDAGGGTWGVRTITVHFHVGDAHVSYVDVVHHTMTVTSNGKVVAVFPQSSGRDKYPTMNGVHRVLAKSTDVLMDSSTNGIPVNSPDGYYEHVYWDVQISNTGEYVHAAPWSVDAQGNSNVSHGCVNLSTNNAQWFYGFSLRGDLVIVTGSPRAPTDDAGTIDWNTPFDQWVSGPTTTPAPRQQPS